MAAASAPDGDDRRAADGARSPSGSEDNKEVKNAAAPSGRLQRLTALLANAEIDHTADEIQRLRAERRALNERKRVLARSLRNESRKRARMMQRSAQLTNEDLVEVLHIRQTRAVAKAKAEAAPEEDP
jgi:hypothetical protein